MKELRQARTLFRQMPVVANSTILLSVVWAMSLKGFLWDGLKAGFAAAAAEKKSRSYDLVLNTAIFMWWDE